MLTSEGASSRRPSWSRRWSSKAGSFEAPRARVDGIQKKIKRIVPRVFCRDDGAPVGDFKKAWATACMKAGFFRVVPVGEPKEDEPPKTRKVPTKIFHGTRRSAVRGLAKWWPWSAEILRRWSEGFCDF